MSLATTVILLTGYAVLCAVAVWVTIVWGFLTFRRPRGLYANPEINLLRLFFGLLTLVFWGLVWLGYPWTFSLNHH